MAGGAIPRWADFERQIVAAAPAGLSAPTLRHLARSYGTEVPRILDLIKATPAYAAHLPDTGEVIAAEVVHAVRAESALHLVDVVLNRTDLGSKGHPGGAALEACATLMARELGWDAATRAGELATAEARFRFAD